MVAHNKKKEPKPLRGLSLTIVQEQEDKTRKVLGVVMAKNLESLKEIFKVIHQAKIDVNLPDVRGATLIIDP